MIVLVLASILSLTNRFGSVSVDTTGARVLSYVPDGGREVFARLPSGYGGVPLCWPWFQYNGPRGDRSPKHGLVREREFATVECANGADRSLAVLRLESDDATRRIWPHDFVLTVRIELSERGLALDMTGENTGESPFEVTEAFHPYLLRTERERIPDDGTGEFRTWDPDASSHLKTQGLAPDDWRTFLCVENGTFLREKAYRLAPGARHTLSRRFRPRLVRDARE